MRTSQACFVAVVLSAAALFPGSTAEAQVPPLSEIPVPQPSNLGDFVRDKKAAEILGKALFWDMQVGSDGVQACATCHFRAGADTRNKNQVSPGLLRVRFGSKGTVKDDPDLDFSAESSNGGPYVQGPNYRLRPSDFPLRKLKDDTNRESSVVADTNNVVSSQGVHHAIYGFDGFPAPDPEGFRVGNGPRGANVRRVEPRNTPTMINAVFNHRNFWDMRAQNVFNGVNPFGALDSQTRALMQEMLLGIWEESHKTVVFVTHDIDEALFLGDVVYVMSARPGRIKREIAVDIARPRSLEVLTAPAFTALKREVLGLIRTEAMRALQDAAARSG